MSDLDFSIDPPGVPAVAAPDGDQWGDVDPFDQELTPDPMALVVTEELVADVLEGLGEVANEGADRDVPEQWLFREREVATLAPPLTRIANRHEWARRLLLRGDGLLVGLGLFRYGRRNVRAGLEARQNREENDGSHLGAEDRAGPSADPGAHHPGGGDWGLGVPPDEAAGLGQFQG